jgi:hypothetical protein
VCNSESNFLLSAFLQDPSTKPTGVLIFFCLYEPNKTKKWCVVLSILKRTARLPSIITVFFRASKLMPACSPCWSFLSLYGGFKFQSCAIALSNCSKTSQDVSNNHYSVFPLQYRRCCVVIGNVR